MLIYLCLGGAVLLTAADYFFKQLVVEYLKPIGSYQLWPGVLHLTYHQNTGAAFSILSDSTRLLIALTSAAIALIVAYMLVKKPKSRWVCAALMLILAGGLGNLIDRVLLGYVVDYIDFTLINFAVFNFADMCAVCGTIMLACYFVFEDVFLAKRRHAQETSKAAQSSASAEGADAKASSAEQAAPGDGGDAPASERAASSDPNGEPHA